MITSYTCLAELKETFAPTAAKKKKHVMINESQTRDMLKMKEGIYLRDRPKMKTVLKQKQKDFHGKIWEIIKVCAHARWSWLGHPTLFNVTLTSKPCVQALNADRMEQVFI